jgi:hypothetical protein
VAEDPEPVAMTQLQRHVVQGAHFDAPLPARIAPDEAAGRSREQRFAKALLRPVNRKIDRDVVEN